MIEDTSFTTIRWNNLREVLLEIAQGNLSKKTRILQQNDDLESIEVLVNIIVDEWRQRVLQLPFHKPTESKKFINHFQIILNKKLQIIDSDKCFPDFLGIDLKLFYRKNIIEIIDADSLQDFTSHLDNINNKVVNFSETPSLTLLGTPFLFNINQSSFTKNYFLNLFQINLNIKHFKKGIQNNTTEMIKLEQKKRYRDIVQEIKKHIDQQPLFELIELRKLCIKFGINSFQLKTGFQELYQTSVYDYFLTLRMKHAYLLIETCSFSLKEISQMIGYAHYSTFSAQFYKLFKIRPRELRKEAVLGNDLGK